MKHILSIILLFFSTAVMAQSSRGDNLYAEGMNLQQTQTVASQKSAIQKFQQAKVAYNNVEKKKLCDTQIAVCNKNMKRILANQKQESKQREEKKPEQKDAASSETPAEKAKEEVRLTVSETRLDFKAHAKENKTVAVFCNYDGWKISSKPEWLKVYVAPGEFSVIPEDNEGDDRSGIIDITCQDQTVHLVVNQSKLKGFKGLLKNLK